jgi:hypothetical protein
MSNRPEARSQDTRGQAVDDGGKPRTQRAEVNGRHVWVVEDSRGIVEMTESEDTLRHDHPEAFPDSDTGHA